MVVTTAALEREAEEGRAESGDAVVDVVDAVFLLDRATLGLLRVETVEGGGEDLIVGGLRQEVAGELIGDEFIPREVLVEGLDDPVAPWPHVALAVDLETITVGVAGDIEPIRGHAFAVARRGEQAIHEPRQRIGRAIRDESINVGERGREAREIKGEATDERDAIGLGLRCELATGQTGEGETINRRNRGRACGQNRRGGRCHGCERLERPMRLVLRAFVDPALERGDFFGRQAADLGLGRGHDFLVVGALDAEHQFALGAVAGDDHREVIFDA